MQEGQPVCRLCQQESKLLRSHIIPKFVMKECLDTANKNRYWVLSSDPEKSERLEQRHVTERLLCAECEQSFSRYEAYASRYFKVDSGQPPLRDGSFYTFPHVDYTSIRLFYLSILWRMSVSHHPFFRTVSLGKHEDILRKHLLSGKAPTPYRYSFWCTVPLVKGHFHTDWVQEPHRIKIAGQTAYPIVLNGILVVFMVSCRPAPKALRPLILGEDGVWRFEFKPVEEIGYLKKWIIATQEKEE